MSVNTILNEDSNPQLVMHEHHIHFQACHAQVIYCSDEQHVLIKYRSWPLCVLRDSSFTCITAWDKHGGTWNGYLSHPDFPGGLNSSLTSYNWPFVFHFLENRQDKKDVVSSPGRCCSMSIPQLRDNKIHLLVTLTIKLTPLECGILNS